MSLQSDQRGFVMSGAALLLVLPAMLLAASFFGAVWTGGEAVSTQATSDKVFYTGKDVERAVKNVWDENLLFDNEPNVNARFAELSENYRSATGLHVVIKPNWMLWTRYEEKESHAGTQSKIARVSSDNWLYYFESYQIVADYDDIVLRVSRTDENLKITIEDFDPVYNMPIDVYYENTLLWNDATSANVGESRTIAGTIQLIVSLSVGDPRNAVQYTSTVEVG